MLTTWTRRPDCPFSGGRRTRRREYSRGRAKSVEVFLLNFPIVLPVGGMLKGAEKFRVFSIVSLVEAEVELFSFL